MSTKDFSTIQEHSVADYLDWQVVAGSGAAACYPGDVIGDDWLGECKTHVAPGHKIYFNHDVWNKIVKESMVKHRYPVLITDDGTQNINHTWCLLRRDQVDLERFVPTPRNIGVQVNISISLSNLNEIHHEINSSHTDDLVHIIEVDWKHENVCIVPIQVFKNIIE